MFIVDPKLLKEYDLDINEFLALAKIFYNLDIKDIDTLNYAESLQDKNYIKLINNTTTIIIREKTAKLFKLLQSFELKVKTQDSKKVIKSDLALKYEVDSFISEFRNKWKGLKPGSMGSPQSCKDKMLRWCKLNPSYTKEDILKAADIYIKSLKDFKYLQSADYFIYKQDGKVESSRLSAFVDEIDNYNDEDWTTKIV